MFPPENQISIYKQKMFFAFFFVKPTCNEVDLAHQTLVYKSKKSRSMHKTLCDSNGTEYLTVVNWHNRKILFWPYQILIEYIDDTISSS